MLASLLGVTITNGFFSVIDFYWVLTHDLWLQAQSSDYYAMTASFCMPTDNHNHLCVLALCNCYWSILVGTVINSKPKRAF